MNWKARLRIRSLPNPQSTWSTEEQPPAPSPTSCWPSNTPAGSARSSGCWSTRPSSATRFFDFFCREKFAHQSSISQNCSAYCPIRCLCLTPSLRIFASCALWHFWHRAARLSRLAASGRWSKTWAAVSTTLLPVTGCGLPFSAPHHSHLFFARMNRTNLLRSFQSFG